MNDDPPHDCSMCAPEFLTPPERPSRRLARIKTIAAVFLIVAILALGQWIDS